MQVIRLQDCNSKSPDIYIAVAGFSFGSQLNMSTPRAVIFGCDHGAIDLKVRVCGRPYSLYSHVFVNVSYFIYPEHLTRLRCEKRRHHCCWYGSSCSGCCRLPRYCCSGLQAGAIDTRQLRSRLVRLWHRNQHRMQQNQRHSLRSLSWLLHCRNVRCLNWCRFSFPLLPVLNPCRMCRKHNDANVMSLGGRTTGGIYRKLPQACLLIP